MTKQVEVKIAVAIDSKGNWNSSGWSDKSGKSSPEAMGLAGEVFEEQIIANYWITAKLDLPEEILIDAEGIEKQ